MRLQTLYRARSSGTMALGPLSHDPEVLIRRAELVHGKHQFPVNAMVTAEEIRATLVIVSDSARV